MLVHIRSIGPESYTLGIFLIIYKGVSPPGKHHLSWRQVNNPKHRICCRQLLREGVWVLTSYQGMGGATKKMKNFFDHKHCPTDYEEDYIFLAKFNPRQFKSLRGVHQNLGCKYEGPFKIVAKVGKISYMLELLPHIKIHMVSHARVLKPYHEDNEDPSRNRSQWASITVISFHDREIETIMDYQAKWKRGQQDSAMFLVHWKGQTPKEIT